MSSVIYTHFHNNIDVLNNFSESPNGEVLYKGNLLTGSNDDTHILASIYSEAGVHDIRFYNSKLQYYNNSQWNDIATGGGTTINVDKDIIISPSDNNALVKYTNGYYVQGFLISKQINNALVKYSDGYYVPQIPINNATLDDVNEVIEIVNQDLTKQNQTFNERYDLIINKISQISSNTTKFKQHEFSGTNTDMSLIIDISTLYDMSINVILNLEIMIVNESNTDLLNIKILENDIATLEDALLSLETQRYKLPNISQFKIYIKGNFKLYIYVNYI